jgi:hypothetical protein
MKHKGIDARLWRLFVCLSALVLTLAGAIAPVTDSAAQGPEPGQNQIVTGLAEELVPRPGLAMQPSAAPVEVASSSTTLSYATDTEIRQAQPSTNLGNELPIYVGYPNRRASRMLLEIPLWDLPAGAQIDSAILKVYLSGWLDYEGKYRTITAYRAASLWHEKLATWNHAPALGEQVGSLSIGTPSAGTWYSLDLTNLVRSWNDSTYFNDGIVLVGPEGGLDVYRIFASSETTNYPRLEVTYTLQPPTLETAPTALAFSVNPLFSPPLTQTLHVVNSGSQPLQWQVDSAPSWAVLSAASGAVGAGSFHGIEVNVDTAGLGYGTHVGQVQISSSTPGVQGSPLTIPITLSYSDKASAVHLPIILGTGTGGVNPARKVAILLIGIADYEYLPSADSSGSRAGDPESGDLLYPVYDVKYTNEVFSRIGPSSSGLPCATASGFSTADVSAAVCPCDDMLTLADSQAGLADIQAAFRWLDDHEDADTLVIIAYSGHGGQVLDDDGDESDGRDEFIAPYDIYSDGTTYHNIIRDDDLDEWLSTLESRQIVVLLDSCYSGGMMGATALKSARGLNRGLPLPGNLLGQASPVQAADANAFDIGQPGRVILAASRSDQGSQEFYDLSHGVFTYYMLMALMDPAADTDHNGWVSAQEAYAYLAAKVDNYVWQNAGEHQNPQMYDGVSGQVDLTRPQ